MKYAMVIGSLFFFLALKVVLSANIASKLKQSDRRAIGLVPYPRVGRSRREPSMLVMRNPRVGRSFVSNANIVSEPDLDADIILESNHGPPILDMDIEHQGLTEIDEPIKQLQMLPHMAPRFPYFENKFLEPYYRRILEFPFPWTFFYSRRGSSNSENTRWKRSVQNYVFC